MSRKENVTATFREGFNCAQSVFSTFSEELGLDCETALKIAGAFGGGMCNQGKTCGAVTGALMVLGLKFPRLDPKSDDQKEMIRNFGEDFMIDFEERNNDHTYCRDLLDCDLSTPEGLRFAKENDLRKNCEKFVQDAVAILEEILA